MRHEWSTFEAQALMAAKSASVAQIVLGGGRDRLWFVQPRSSSASGDGVDDDLGNLRCTVFLEKMVCVLDGDVRLTLSTRKRV